MIIMIASALVKRDGKFLIVKNTRRDKWETVGGHMIDGETLTETVKREVFEETGLDFWPGGIIGVYSDQISNNKTMVHVLFSGTETTGLPVKLSDEHYDFKWLDFPQLSALNEPMTPVLANWVMNPNFGEFFNDVQVLPPYNPMPELNFELPQIGPGPKQDNSMKALYDYAREQGDDLRDLSHRAGRNMPDKLPDPNDKPVMPTQAELDEFADDIMNIPMDDELFGGHNQCQP